MREMLDVRRIMIEAKLNRYTIEEHLKKNPKMSFVEFLFDGLLTKAQTDEEQPASLKAPGGKCSGSGMTQEARDAFLNAHNKFRSLVAKGLAQNPLGSNGYAPKAARMLKMDYDCTVEQSAMNHAKLCQFKHSKGSGYGENLWMIMPQNNDYPAMATQASQSWFSELKTAGVPPDNRLTMQLWNRPKQIGHYTQMVWETSNKLGCGIALCGRMTLVVCQYAPRGNMMGSMIYTIGEPCSGCTCSGEEGLCIA
ncbi:hypothetical protein KIN20_004510 [Parelaphostrongylus tenuis]|uniref:SCP domain-containing protein n=1 Tax=Parelaphostrongylus tenuis TaxID=148309 RepID=A0AAD5MJW2_PARTN|nr:hypothetical protein KIN20_004510 [Parelaphostrongylus tenuis]